MKRMIILMYCLVSWFTQSSDALAGDVDLLVAASLKEVTQELSQLFEQKHPGIRIVQNQGASGTLAKQIENAAPADVFISASPKWIDYLKQKRMLTEGSITTFAYNELVFVGKPGLKVGRLQELPGLERIAIGSPKSVPAGEYAMEAFRKAGIDKQLEKRLVMARDVRECMLYAERGEVDGAIVYKTDAQLLGKATKILFVVPQNLYSRVTYPMALIGAGGKKSEAAAFFAFLQSPEAKAVLAKYGFNIR